MRFAAIVALLLCSCAPSLVASNSAGGTVDMKAMMSGQSEAMALAERECQKYGKVARSAGVNEIRNSLRYECVVP